MRAALKVLNIQLTSFGEFKIVREEGLDRRVPPGDISTMSAEGKRTTNNHHLSRIVKTVIVVQAAVILSFTIGMYQEYLSNAYLQDYVVSLFTSNIVADTLLSAVTVSVFAIGTFTLLGSMSSTRRTGKEWKDLSTIEEEGLSIPSMPVLEKIDPPVARKSLPKSRRPRQRIDNEQIFRSLTQYTQNKKHEQ